VSKSTVVMGGLISDQPVVLLLEMVVG
jgi:hypothetical protein